MSKYKNCFISFIMSTLKRVKHQIYLFGKARFNKRKKHDDRQTQILRQDTPMWKQKMWERVLQQVGHTDEMLVPDTNQILGGRLPTLGRNPFLMIQRKFQKYFACMPHTGWCSGCCLALRTWPHRCHWRGLLFAEHF